jgi:antitoxin component of RelBE/YafQ-DinJ toxin-antitoxin module
MSVNSVVRARIDEQIKNEAAAALKAMGLTVLLGLEEHFAIFMNEDVYLKRRRTWSTYRL